MNSSVASSRLDPEFDAFLFAQVGEDKTGLPISVVTVLARLDVDPWQAAARLTALSPESAAQEVASMLGVLQYPTLISHDILATAARLVAKLPPPKPSQAVPPQTIPVSGAKSDPRHRANVLFLAIYLISMLATQFLIVSLAPIHAVPLVTSPSDSGPSQRASAPPSG
jgi:hypothetical protein